MNESRAVRHCPFDGCDWTHEYDPDSYASELSADMKAERHYEETHGGRVRIQVTLESTQILGDRDPEEIRKRQMEKYEDEGHDVAFVRTEVLEESDDHSRSVPREDTSE